MEKTFKFQSQGYDILYGQGLLNEYDEILLGKRRKFSSMYFNFSDSTNELMALSVIKYAIEHYLKWKPNEAYNMLTKKVLKQLHLSSLLTYIKFPIELNKIKDFQMKLLEYVKTNNPEIITQINSQGTLDEGLISSIVDLAKTFREEYLK